VKKHECIRADTDAPADWKFDPSKPVDRITLTQVGGGDTVGSGGSGEAHAAPMP
jgi:hypothetical protein